MGAKFSSGGGATVFYDKTDTPGEIVTELVNASDGAGLHFDGSAGNIDIATPPDLGTAFSFEFVIKADAFGTFQQNFVDFGTGGRFVLASNSSMSWNLGIYDQTSWKSFGVKVLDDLKVHHLVVTVDGTAAVLYDNGNQVATVTISSGHAIDSCTDAKIGSAFNGSGDFVEGTYYRTRFYNKALTSAEVQTAYERADVDFADQYGEQNLVDADASVFTSGTYSWVAYGTNAIANVSNNLTITYGNNEQGAYNYLRDSSDLNQDLVVGKKYRLRITAKYAGGVSGVQFELNNGATLDSLGALTTSFAEYVHEFTAGSGAASAYLRLDGLATGNVVTIDTWQVDEIGCVSDYQTQWANPTQSLTVQDRAGSADGSCSASGVTQVQKVVQVNATSARIGTSAATPADGEVVANKGKFDGDNSATPLTVNGGTLSVPSVQLNGGTNQDDNSSIQAKYSLVLASNSTNAIANRSIVFKNGTATQLSIASDGKITVGNNLPVWSGAYGGALFLKGDNATSDRYAQLAIVDSTGAIAQQGLKIDSSGNLLLGKTSAGVTTLGVEARQNGILAASRDGATALFVERKTSDGSCVELIRGGTTVGTISVTGSATAYNTSSDYRLKENLTPLTGALDRLDALPVYRFNFKADPDTTVDGFVAHEVSEHVPEAVTGEKDAMKTVVVQEAVEAQPATYYEEGDELPEGKAVGDEKTPAVEAVAEVTEEQPDYQGIDQSKLVPLLVAAVKELKAKVETLENA